MHRALAAVLVIFTAARAAAETGDDELIRRAADAYRAWGRVDERPNIAPFLCRSPTPADFGAPSHVRRSAASEAPHGRKLYYLWASDRDAYLHAGSHPPVGLAIVKESFDAVASTGDPPPRAPRPWSGNPPINWMVTDRGERLAVGDRRDLFVMVKTGERAGSDAGWIYGTVAPDGTVTSAGRVERCMSCHTRHAPHERLFGLPPAPKS